MFPSVLQLWKDTGAWYWGHHPAFDMEDDKLTTQVEHLQMELHVEEDFDTHRLTQAALNNSDEELHVQSPTPQTELGGIGHVLFTCTMPSPQIPPPGKFFTFTRQLSRSLPSLLTASDTDLLRITEEADSVDEQQLSSSYAAPSYQKSLTLPMDKRSSSWLDTSTNTFQDVRLDVSLPRSVARLRQQTPSHTSMASLTDRSDLGDSSHDEEGADDEKELSPAASAHRSIHESSLEENGSEHQGANSLTQRLEDLQEWRRNFAKARRHSLTKFVKKAEGLIKSFSSNASSRETSPGEHTFVPAAHTHTSHIHTHHTSTHSYADVF